MVAARVGVLGSANMDLVVATQRAPQLGETVTGRAVATVPGGKGANQALAAARAGAHTVMSGAVGTDTYGDELLATLTAAGVDASAVIRVAGATGTAHIVVDERGDNAIVVVPGANGTVVEPTATQLALLEEVDWLLLQLELPLRAIEVAACAAHARGVRVVLTPAPAAPLSQELLGRVDLLVPNEHELRVLAGVEDLDAAAGALLELIPQVVVTLGAAGAAWYRRGQAPLRLPAREVPVRDTTAAGDTFVGALVTRLAEGTAMPEALSWANAAAALSVQRDGASTSMPRRAEIDAFA